MVQQRSPRKRSLVRAIAKGFDGEIRRNPGDEFMYDESRRGIGSWYEFVEPSAKTLDTGRAKKKAKKKAANDDLI